MLIIAIAVLEAEYTLSITRRQQLHGTAHGAAHTTPPATKQDPNLADPDTKWPTNAKEHTHPLTHQSPAVNP